MKVSSIYLALIALALLTGCENEDANATASGLLQFGNDNPPANEQTWATVSKLVCRPAVVDVCGPLECKSGKIPETYVVWKPSENEYQRCDNKSCDSYTPIVKFSGSFTNLSLPENAMLFRVSTDRSYLEIATILDSTLVYRGNCNPN